jgi:hypothetical protein
VRASRIKWNHGDTIGSGSAQIIGAMSRWRTDGTKGCILPLAESVETGVVDLTIETKRQHFRQTTRSLWPMFPHRGDAKHTNNHDQ